VCGGVEDTVRVGAKRQSIAEKGKDESERNI